MKIWLGPPADHYLTWLMNTIVTSNLRNIVYVSWHFYVYQLSTIYKYMDKIVYVRCPLVENKVQKSTTFSRYNRTSS